LKDVTAGWVSGDRLVAVTLDMAQGYINANCEHAPKADLAFDRFHIEYHLTDAVDQVRKAEFWRKGGPHREAIRGKKCLLSRSVVAFTGVAVASSTSCSGSTDFSR
jgi:hypothetical protein